jgi:arylsulfatase A-like enzyme
MNKNHTSLFSVGLCIALLAFYPSPGRLTKAKAARPNVLILLADDMTFSALGALQQIPGSNRSPEIKTPTLDSLMRVGTTFSNACIMGGLVPAICSPSRSMLLTGRGLYRIEPLSTKQLGTNLVTGRYETFPQTFQKAGYVTFTTGKHHNGQAELSLGYTLATSVFFGGMTDHFNTPGFDLSPDGNYPPTNARKATHHSSEEYAGATIDFIRHQANADRPFLAYVPFRAPHDPRQAPADYRKRYEASQLTLPTSVMPDHPFDAGVWNIRDEQLLTRPRNPERIKAELADYYAMITHLDAQIGRILAALRATNQADNTVVVFAADNGLSLGQHGLLGKQNLYDHSVRVPMIWAGPGIPKGQRRGALAYLHDVFPTLCELADVAPPKTVEATSLVSAIRNPRAVVRSNQYLNYGTIQRGLRSSQYKLIEYAVSGKRTTQLFDLEKDPFEVSNLATDPRYAGRLITMRTLLQRERATQGDTTSAFWNHF